MRIDLYDPDEFIAINKMKDREITSPVLFQRGNVPHPDGLVSNEIFGVTIKSRKERFAYIDLHGHYFSPHIYKAVRRMFRNVDKIISGEEYYRVDEEGHLVKDPEGNTGIEWLYKVWPTIKWKRSDEKGMRNERIDLVTKTPLKEVFISKWIVIPAYYRDITTYQKGGGETTDLNTYYSTLVRLASLTKEKELFDFSLHSTNVSIQAALVAIYDYFKQKLEKKTGLFRKYLMGKNVDYCTRTVITAPTFHANKPEEMPVNFKYCGLPISQICTLCYPFMVNWVQDFFDREFIQNKYAKNVYDPESDSVTEILSLKNPESYFNDKYVKRLIETYQKDPESRFNTIEIPVEGDKKYYAVFTGKRLDPSSKAELGNMSSRKMTWTDLMYMAAVDSVEGKHALVTRYPVSDQFGVFISKIHVLSTCETEVVEVNGKIYNTYPKVRLNLPRETILTSFIDSTQFSNSYLVGLNGDYDGDQTTVKVLWSMEANDEADKMLNNKSYYLTVNGEMIRKIENEAIQTLFTLTKNPTKESRSITPAEKAELLALSPTDLTYQKLLELFADTKEPGGFKIKKSKFQPHDKMKLTAKESFSKEELDTTVGRFIYNKLIVEGCGFQNSVGYVNTVITQKQNNKIEAVIAENLLTDNITVQQMIKYIDTRDWLALQLHGAITSSFTPDTIKVPPKVKALKNELLKKYQKELQEGDERVCEMIENELIEAIKKEYADDVGLDLYVSGARGSISNNLKNIFLMKGAVENPVTGGYDIITNSLMDGLEKDAIPSSSNSIVSGAYPKACGTAVSGYMAKKLLAAAQTESLDKRGSDCGSKRTIDIILSEKNIGDFKYRYIVEGDKLVLLTPSEARKRIGRKVKMRSPQMCCGDKLCNHCAGDLYYMLGIENIGLSTSKIATTLTNANMKKFHDNTVTTAQLNVDDLYF